MFLDADWGYGVSTRVGVRARVGVRVGIRVITIRVRVMSGHPTPKIKSRFWVFISKPERLAAAAQLELYASA